MITQTDFERYHLPRIKAWYGFFDAASKDAGVPVSVLAAIACRETNVRNISGDSGHGHGVMQIDDRSHSAFTSSQAVWDVGQNILYAARLLASNIRDAASHGIDDFNSLRVAVAAYNHGPGAIHDYQVHGNPDLNTYNGDYSRDVLQVAGWVEEALPAAASSKKKFWWWLTGVGALLIP